MGCHHRGGLQRTDRSLGLRGPIAIVSQTSCVRIVIENPLKPLIVAAAALQVWCLLTPRVHAAAQRWFAMSLWRVVLWMGAVESGVLALISIVHTDLGWESASVWSHPTPTKTATISFLLSAVALSRKNPLSNIYEMMQRCGTQWRRWNWRSRIVIAMLCLDVLLTGNFLLGYWHQASNMFAVHNQSRACMCDDDGKPISDFDTFCRLCVKQIPANARILYHGPNYGLILAFELYPRRVFMLPQEQKDMFHYCWRQEKWCTGMTADPLDHLWKWDPPLTAVSERQFIAEHQITCVMTFDDRNVANNCIRNLR